METATLKQIIVEQKEEFLSKTHLIPREIDNYEAIIRSKQIIVISGVRRCGKSSCMSLIAQNLIQIKNALESNILYLNFENEKFVDFTYKDFNKILEAYYELYPDINGKIYAFFDEIQNIEYWEKWVNSLYEKNHFKIFISGSNATLLSSEIATALTGRNYLIELFPFSFKEYLKLKQENISGHDLFNTKNIARIKSHFSDYLIEGGFPEYLLNPDLNILNEYFKNILYRDIIVRHQIKNIRKFREIALYIISNFACRISYSGLGKFMAIASVNTVKNYLQYLEDAYLHFKVPLFSPSLKKQIRNPFKNYVIDNGMSRKVSFSISDNWGRYFENLAFLELRRQKDLEIYYYNDDFEVDFVTKKGNKIVDCIQVCYDISNPATLEREKKALITLLNTMDKKSGIIINNSDYKEEKIQDKTIVYIPLWKWLLGEF